MATINLGAIKFNWKGAYNSGTSYAVDDVVSSGGNSYVCIQAHSNQAVGNATAYWNIMSSAGTNGTNGTDLTSTLTAQGDMLYRDGSGLQRLAKGTASQELRMNSGATAPEWHTPAVATSDFVLLSTVSITSSTSSAIFDNHFSSTYKNYKVIMSIRPEDTAANHNYPIIQFRRSGSDVTSSYHTLANHVDSYDNPSDSNQLQRAYADYQNATTYGKLGGQNWSGGIKAGSSGYYFDAEMTIFDPLGTDNYKTYVSTYRQQLHDGYMSTGTATASQYGAVTAISGFKIKPRNGRDMRTATIKLYGIK